MSSKIVYTSIFGGYDDVQKQNLPDGWDWKCFSEENSLPLYKDDNRNAKRFKVLLFYYFIKSINTHIYINYYNILSNF